MSNELSVVKINSLSEIEKIANSMVKSKLFGVESFDQAFSLMMVANARGIHPVKAAMDYHIIQGKPALKADAMLAYFQESGGIVQWKVYTDTCVIGLFSHPRSGQNEPLEIEWTIEMAAKIMTWEKGRQIPLAQKQVWKDYPRAMLRSRCISEGVRTVYPGIISGFYTEEEVSSFVDNDKFNKAKHVDAKEVHGAVIEQKETVYHQPVESPKPESVLPDGVTEEEFKDVRAKFIIEATEIRNEYNRFDYDEGCQGDDWLQIVEKLKYSWAALCYKYASEHSWFKVPPQWDEGMAKLLGIVK